MHKRADGVYKATFNINTAARAWAARVRQRPGPQAIKPPRRACAQAGAPAPPPNQERHRGGWRKNTRGVSILCIYYIPSTRNPHPKGALQNRRPPSESRLWKISKIGQKAVLCWSCLSTADGQILLYTPFPLVLPGARNTRQARRAQHRGTAWASNRTSEQRRARR